jgi:hypothetical protein
MKLPDARHARDGEDSGHRCFSLDFALMQSGCYWPVARRCDSGTVKLTVTKA